MFGISAELGQSTIVIIIFSVLIDTVKEIRCGKNTDVFREMDRDDFQEDCAFSIIYSDSYETLNLVAYSPDEANIWVTGLRCLLDSDKGKICDITQGANCCASQEFWVQL